MSKQKQCRTRSNAHFNGILTMQMMGYNRGYTLDLPRWKVRNVIFNVHGVDCDYLK